MDVVTLSNLTNHCHQETLPTGCPLAHVRALEVENKCLREAMSWSLKQIRAKKYKAAARELREALRYA